MADRILIVDDEVEIADLIEVYLRNEDYEVLKFYTAKEALACMKNTPVPCHFGCHAAGYERVYTVSENQGNRRLSRHYADGKRC